MPDAGSAGLNEVVGFWLSVWRKHPEPQDFVMMLIPEHAPRLPPIDASEVQRACETYPQTKAQGLDDWSIKRWSWLPSEFHERLAALLNELEMRPQRLKELATQVVLLEKSATATRPIGLLAGLWRLWARVRLQHAQRWEREHELPAHWGGRHRDCETYGWRQELNRELALATGQHMGSVLVDLTKAFEHVRHDLLVANALAYDFPQQ
eukprot:6462707-Amphidinium_carterae.1